MRRLADHASDLAASLRPRVVYVDLDGTLLGPGGSLFAAERGAITTRAVEALGRLHRAGVALVPMSGRTEHQVREVARVVGAGGFIAELGGVISREGSVHRRRGSAPVGPIPTEAMIRGGGPGFLLERFPRRLVPHRPWSDLPRQATLLFRGNVDLAEVAELLERSGYGWLVLNDNGIIRRRFDDLEVREVHAYHLAPRGVNKAEAVAEDVSARGLAPADALVVGDSPADVLAGDAVRGCFLVRNGAWAAEDAANVYVADAAYGDGFAEVMEALLPG